MVTQDEAVILPPEIEATVEHLLTLPEDQRMAISRRPMAGIDQTEPDPSTGFTSEHETRTLLVKRFPHSFAFKDYLRKSWIIAVPHTARRPGY